MRQIFFGALLLIFAIFLPGVAFGNVAGTKHDMYALGKGSDPNVCSYCHIPHKAAGAKIWSYWGNEARLTNGPYSIVGNMCYTCHDGTATTVGQTTAFNTSLQQHKVAAGTDCDLCHDPHDSVNGKFMRVAKNQNSYCAACHNATVNAGGLGNHTGAGNHPSYWTSSAPHITGAACTVCHVTADKSRQNSCYLCHAAHGAVNYSTPSVSRPILLQANTNSAYCALCHPVNVSSGSGDYLKHPANLTQADKWGIVECERCHDPHQPQNPTFPMTLRDQNLDSGYCTQCHHANDEINGPKIGGGHVVNVPLTMTPVDPTLTPVANTINDDGVNGIDYPANSSNLVCETCHSVHRKGLDSRLRRAHSSELCDNCHR